MMYLYSGFGIPKRWARRPGARCCRLFAIGTLAVVALAVVSSCTIEAHDEAESSVFSMEVGEKGTANGLWGPGIKVRTLEGKDLERVTILVPKGLREVIEYTFKEYTSNKKAGYDRIERDDRTKGVVREIVLVVSGNETTTQCHWHLTRYHCHQND